MKELEFDHNIYTRGFNYGWEALKADRKRLESTSKDILIKENREAYNDLIQSIEAITDPIGAKLLEGVRDSFSIFKENVIEGPKDLKKTKGKELGE